MQVIAAKPKAGARVVAQPVERSAKKEEREGREHCKKIYEIPGFVLTKLSWDLNWVNYSRLGRVW